MDGLMLTGPALADALAGWDDITEATMMPSAGPAVSLAWRLHSKRRPAAEININSKLLAQLGWTTAEKVRVLVQPDRAAIALRRAEIGKKLGRHGGAGAICHHLNWITSDRRKAERVPHRIVVNALVLELPDWARPPLDREALPAPAAPPAYMSKRPEPSPTSAPTPAPAALAAPAPAAASEPPKAAVAVHDKATPERLAAFPSLWMNPELSVPEIQRRINDMPGPQYIGKTSMYPLAVRLGLPSQRPSLPVEALPPEPPAAALPMQPAPEPPRPDGNVARASAHAPAKGATISAADHAAKNRQEVEDCMSAGMGARAIADDTGLGLNDVVTLIGRIRADQARAKAGAA
jgi:hypothetical protein